MCDGWAVKNGDGDILINTVAANDTAAMVHWLVYHAGRTVPRGTPDWMIEEMFVATSEMSGHILVRVDVRERLG